MPLCSLGTTDTAHVGDHRVDQADAGAGQQEAAEQRRPLVGQRSRPPISSSATPTRARPDAQQHARGHLRDQRARGGRDEERHDGQRQVAKAGLERRRGRGSPAGRTSGTGTSANIEAETADAASCTPVNVRLRNRCSGSIGCLHARLDRDERRQQHGGAGEQGHDQGRAPALLVAAQQRQHEQEQRRRERHQARPSRCAWRSGRASRAACRR